MIPLYTQIGMAIMWLIFILELFTMMCIMTHNKLAVVIWTSVRIIPLLMVTMGLV